MNLIQLIKKRRSIREYEDKPIGKEIIEQLVEAARFAPTARNVQPWNFIAITNRETLKQLGQICENGRFIAKAAAAIAVFCEDTKYYLEDGCAATENILLAAASLGIGSCWIAGDKKPYCSQVISMLNVPPLYKLISLVALGYPESAQACSIPEKKILSDILHWDKF